MASTPSAKNDIPARQIFVAVRYRISPMTYILLHNPAFLHPSPYEMMFTLSVERFPVGSFPFWSLLERVLTGKLLTGKLTTGIFSTDKVV